MCQTFYLEHRYCSCIYISANFTPCATYSHAHPEGISKPPSNPSADPEPEKASTEPGPFADPEKASPGPDPFADPEKDSPGSNPFADPDDPFADPEKASPASNPFADPDDPSADPFPDTKLVRHASRPKVLTQTHGTVDFTYDNIDFVSVDIDDVRAPKGLQCSEGIEPKPIEYAWGKDSERDDVACWLCDRPEVLEFLNRTEQGQSGDEKGKGKGKGKAKSRGVWDNAVYAWKEAVRVGRGKKVESSSSANLATKKKESEEEKKKKKEEKKEKRKEQAAEWRSMYQDQCGYPINPYC